MLDDQMMPARPTALTRSLGVVGVLFLTLSVATPASSVFVIIPGMFQVAGTGAIWAMLLAGVVCVATAFIYAELSSAWPVAGGEYVAVAHTMGPMSGFIMLGISVFNNLLFPPVAGLGIAAVLSAVVPGLPQIPIAVGVVIASTLVAILNIRVNAVLTGIFLILEVAAILAVTALGFASATRPMGEFLTHPVMLDSATNLAPSSPAAIGLAASIALFALNGYGAAVYFGEEMLDAPRKITRAIMAALVLSLLLEGVPMLAALMGAPDLPTLLNSDDPFGLIAATRGDGQWAQFISIAVVVAIINAVIACILACARFFYSSGRDNCWGRPVDAWMAAIHPRFNSPWVATLLIGVIGVAACFLPLTFLLVVNGTGLVAIYAGICFAAIAGRKSGATDHAHYRMPWYPLAPVIALLALAYVGWTSWEDVDEGRPGLVATFAQIMLSAGYYWFVLRRRGPWTVQIPGVEPKA